MMRVAVAGASGYAGGQLLRLVLAHPELALGAAMAETHAGVEIRSLHPFLVGLGEQSFAPTTAAALAEHDLVFTALPHGASASLVAELPETVRVVDLGADFRLRSADQWEQFYGGAHAGSWTYGLSEWNRAAIAASTRIANPGCYATAIELGLLPIAGLVNADDVVVVAASGTSGAGRTSKMHLMASEVMGSMTAYKVGGVHQHTPEIEQSIQEFAGVTAKVLFTPLLAPMPRGILATITARTGVDVAALRRAFETAYSTSPFVHLLPVGAQPTTAATLGSNVVSIQVETDQRTKRAVVTVALDNLIKGAAGQAIQNANIMLGLDERAGLGS